MSTSDAPEFLTYPSIASTIFDVPEPQDISGKFYYNYFLPDEAVTTDTYANREMFRRHGNKFARHVELQFTPLSAVVPDQPVLTEIELSRSQKQRLLRRNLDKITKNVSLAENVHPNNIVPIYEEAFKKAILEST